MRHVTVGLVGNPNCGKTTLFNALTGSHQHVGNWPGVTVQRKVGSFQRGDVRIEVVDLPGIYSLTSTSSSDSIDTRIACDFLQSQCVDVVVNVVDASNLERNLYLTAQLLEMHVPLVVALNMMDVVCRRGRFIDVARLKKRLGCPVVPLESRRGRGIHRLKCTVVKAASVHVVPEVGGPRFPQDIEGAIDSIVQCSHTRSFAIQLLERDHYACKVVDPSLLFEVEGLSHNISETYAEDIDILIADYRYGFAHEITQAVLTRVPELKRNVTAMIDRIVLNRLLGIPIFLFVMYLMFLFAISIGGIFQDFFDISTSAIFVNGSAHVLQMWGAPPWLMAIVAAGAGKGLNTVLTFIPVIGAMFLFLSFLEDSGYMARAAFVMDRVMQVIGLPGKSLVPMIVGFGCNVPAIMAARTLEHRRDRIVTIMMSPFMSCGARLAIFAVFTAAFFPIGGQNVVFALYLIGIAPHDGMTDTIHQPPVARY